MQIGLDAGQFRELVVRPTLLKIELHSEAAENLLVGTALQESGLRWLKQGFGGPALGVYQIEPRTHEDVWANYLWHRRDGLAGNIWRLATMQAGDALDDEEPFGPVVHAQLVTNLAYATAIARVIYYRDPEPLPLADDIRGLSEYWKRVYNTEKGAGKAEHWRLLYEETHFKYGARVKK